MDAGPCSRSGRMGARGGRCYRHRYHFNAFRDSIPVFVAAEEDALDALDSLDSLDALVVAVVVREF